MENEDKAGQAIAEADASTKSWASVDKAKLPASCFLWVEDPDKKSTWHLPVYEGAGGVDPSTGLYKERGPLNANAVRAALSAVAGGRTGKPMNVPADAIKKLKSLAKGLGIGKAAEEIFILAAVAGIKEHDARPWVPVDERVTLNEQFFSLDQALRDAVKARFGQYCWVNDYSDKEVVFTDDKPMRADVPAGVVAPAVTRMIAFKVVKGAVELTGDPVEVKRVIRYEES